MKTLLSLIALATIISCQNPHWRAHSVRDLPITPSPSQSARLPSFSFQLPVSF